MAPLLVQYNFMYFVFIKIIKPGFFFTIKNKKYNNEKKNNIEKKIFTLI